MAINNFNSDERICPRCQTYNLIKNQYCKNCKYDFDSETKVIKNELLFGLDNKQETTSDKKTYNQRETKAIKIVKIIQNVLLSLVGFWCLLLIFLPLFSKMNLWYYVDKIKDAYGIEINSGLDISNHSNLIDLFKNVFGFINNNEIDYGPSLVFAFYEIIIIVLVCILVILGLVLLFFSTQNIFFRKRYLAFKRCICAIGAISLILMYAFACVGVGNIVLVILCLITLLTFYITDIIDKEKRFVLKHLIHKSITAALLFTLLLTSSFGLVEINITNGANMFKKLSELNNVGNPLTLYCKGIFVEIAQYIQYNNEITDKNLYNLLSILNISSSITQIIYLSFLSLSLVLLLRSFSKQNTRFPINFIFLSAISFTIFIVTLIVFQNTINSIYLQDYIDYIGAVDYEQLSEASKAAVKEANKIFSFSWNMYFSLSLYVLTCIYSVFARKVCYDKTYY